MAPKNSKLVYSTDMGRTCPNCEEAIADCTCNDDSPPEGDGIVRIHLETKGRKGKGVSIVKGLPLDKSALKALAKELKQKCGVGGSVKEFDIEIQGDHRDQLLSLLQKKGYTVKKSGG